MRKQSSKRKSRYRFKAALCATLCLGACSVPTQYSQTNSVPRELIWKIDRDLQLEQDGRVVSEDPQDELTTLVGCHAPARQYAKRSEHLSTRATASLWGGAALFALSFPAGILISEDHSDFTAITVMSSTAILGLGAVIYGLHSNQRSWAASFDAVNSFNDGYANDPNCSALP